MWGSKTFSALLLATLLGAAFMGWSSPGHGEVEGLDDLYRSGPDERRHDRGDPGDGRDRDRRHQRRDRLYTDHDRCRGGVEGLGCAGRHPHHRERRNADYGDPWRREWRDGPRGSGGWGTSGMHGPYDRGPYDHGDWYRPPHGYGPPLRDYGGGDFDGAPRGLGLPYWGPPER
jgi:hypothetical protein